MYLTTRLPPGRQAIGRPLPPPPALRRARTAQIDLPHHKLGNLTADAPNTRNGDRSDVHAACAQPAMRYSEDIPDARRMLYKASAAHSRDD